jgi:hypothetical protein
MIRNDLRQSTWGQIENSNKIHINYNHKSRLGFYSKL